ncbi:M23 family metallopeptidase [Solibacillus sp. FSL W7-1436]|uniref:M23 family metallopeptidase n=1 Tax=Solibacillus sp. FSL W7-1436 TaxID=2921705 RepID=UPI0030FCB499
MEEKKGLLGSAALLAFKSPLLIAIAAIFFIGIGFVLVLVLATSMLGSAGFSTKGDQNLVALGGEYCIYDVEDDYFNKVKDATGIPKRELDKMFEVAVDKKVDIATVLTILHMERRPRTVSQFESTANFVYSYIYPNNMLSITSIATYFAPERDYGVDSNGNPSKGEDPDYIRDFEEFYVKLGPSMYCFGENGEVIGGESGGDLGEYVSGGEFSSPITKPIRITSPFGYRVHPVTGKLAHHDGVDIACRNPDPILSVKPGKVVRTVKHATLGNYVMIDHGNKVHTVYGHLSKIFARVGDTVQAGTKIGACGTTGRSTGDHLHFEVHVNGQWNTPVDPRAYFSF